MLAPVQPRGKSQTVGSVVSFIPRQRTARRPLRVAEKPAAIIIFPGVRYERVMSREPGVDDGAGRIDGMRRNEPLPRH